MKNCGKGVEGQKRNVNAEIKAAEGWWNNEYWGYVRYWNLRCTRILGVVDKASGRHEAWRSSMEKDYTCRLVTGALNCGHPIWFWFTAQPSRQLATLILPLILILNCLWPPTLKNCILSSHLTQCSPQDSTLNSTISDCVPLQFMSELVSSDEASSPCNMNSVFSFSLDRCFPAY